VCATSLSIVTACAAKPPTHVGSSARPASRTAEHAGETQPAWSYEVRLDGTRELSIDARFAPTADDVFAVDQGAAPYVVDVELARDEGFVPLAAQGPGYRVPCRAGCRLRYRFALGVAADALRDIDTAIASGDALMAPPSTWLLSPLSAEPGAWLRFHVILPGNARFASGFAHAADGDPETYIAPAAALDESSFAAFGALHVADVRAGDTTVRLALAPKDMKLTPSEAEAWVSASAGAVANYYQGHLPARHALVVMMKGSGSETRGETLGGGGPAVFIRAAETIDSRTTSDDWVLAHELLHVNFPDLGRSHAWLSEGLATYVEPIARARVGLVTVQKFWRDLMDGLPQGLPKAGDEGLENTHTWGRTYWGGASYCLLADVTIRERTGNRRSLDDVLRYIGKTGAVDDTHWDVRQFLEAGQRATGTAVLEELYDSLALKPGLVNLSELFDRLGVHSEGGSVRFDDSAPLAGIRRSIAAR